MKEIVASGQTVEDAKQKAFRELGVEFEENVEVEIIDEGSKGVFGFGTKLARVKVKLLKEAAPGTEAKVFAMGEVEEAQKKYDEKKRSEERKKVEDRSMYNWRSVEIPPITVGEKILPVSQFTVEVEKKEKEFDEEEFLEKMEREEVPAQEAGPELLHEEEGGVYSPREILKKVMELMGARGEVQIKRYQRGNIYSIEGKDLGVLIGKHGQTLESLQFILNLILLRRTNIKRKITIDVEGYRSRREKSLQELAKRLAEKAKREKRNIVLEPMLPSERRIIHMTLQDNPFVSTYSQGEEPMRKVIISPRKRKGPSSDSKN